MSTERPSKTWTDNDPEFAKRIGRLATLIAYGEALPADTDPLDVAAARLWLEYMFPIE